MRVILDTTIYRRSPSGGGLRYLDELADRLIGERGVSVDLAPYARPPNVTHNIEDISIASPGTSTRSAALTAVRSRLHPAKQAIERIYWQLKYRHARDTVFHSLFHYQFADLPVPKVVTIHDMIFELFPEMWSGETWDAERAEKKSAAKKAVRCIAISIRTKSDLCRIYGLSPDKVDVIYHGVNTREFNANPVSGEDDFLRLSGLGDFPYILYVGGRANHKNFRCLLGAYAAKMLHREIALVVAGSPWSVDEKDLLRRLGLNDRIRLLVNPHSSQLAALYRNAKVFVYPSLYEGFGLPVIEAMACGAPVALSDAGPLPEIAADAAEYFNPYDEQSLGKAIEVLLDPAQAKRRRVQGLERATQFSWEQTSKLTVDCYRKALGTA